MKIKLVRNKQGEQELRYQIANITDVTDSNFF
jgi:hypothetical protein